MRIAWLTDIHLNFLNKDDITRLYQDINETKADIILIAGDIGESDILLSLLREFDTQLQAPVYFVLGNHDYYYGSIMRVRMKITEWLLKAKRLTYLNNFDIIKLTDKTCLIGHDSWADGGYGDYENSDVLLNDYFIIEEFRDLPESNRLALMKSLADEAAVHIKRNLNRAFETADNVILLTHVPPFAEVSLYHGEISDDMHLPHFSCKIVGDTILEIMNTNPEKKLTVLCGHTHGQADLRVLPNLHVLVGRAEYGKPEIQQILIID